MQGQRMIPHGPMIPTVEGSSYCQQMPNNGRAMHPVSISNSNLHMHYNHQGYGAPTTNMVAYTGAQSGAQ